MPVIFDYQCSECDEVFEALTMNADTPPKKCGKCGSETAEFKKFLAAPMWIEGTTPGSKPPTTRGKWKKFTSTKDLYTRGT